MAPPNREVQPTEVQTVNSPTENQTEAVDSSSLFLQVHSDRTPKVLTEREVFGVAEQSYSKVRPGETAVYPNQLIAEAQSAGKEIASYLQSGRNPSDIIQYRDATGQLRETTVGERVEQLRILINQDCQNAIGAANELIKRSPNLDKDLETATARLQTAAQQAGLDYNSPNFRQQIANNRELSELAKQQELLQSARMAPGSAMLAYAMLKAEGLTEKPVESMEAFKTTGMPKPTTTELNDAFLLVSQAGRTNTEVFNSPMYAAVNTAVKADYAQSQQEKGNKIVTMIKEADQLSQSGDSAKAELKYKEAFQLGETIDQKFLAAQLRLKDNQTNPEVQQALVGIMSDVKEARMHYANFLVKQGKYEDALPIALKVGADTPEFAQSDPTYNKLVSDATFGKSLPEGELKAHQAKFQTLMQDTNNPNRFTEAQKELDIIVKNFQDTKATLDHGKGKLDEEKKAIDTQLQDLLKKKDTLDPTEFEIEQKRLENEKKVIEAVQEQNDKFGKQEGYLKYLQGVLAYSKDDKDTAHALFKEVKELDPELAKNPEVNLDALLDATKHLNWFQRNWKAIASVGAVLAGVAVGACLFWTGPGAVAGGVGTTAALLTAIGAGAVAGGTVYVGTKGAALGFDQVGWRDFKDGALLGAAGAAPFAPVGAIGAGANVTAQTVGWTARGASAFRTLGITGRTLAVGAGLSATKQGFEMYDGKSFGDAAKSFAMEAPINAMTMGVASNASTLGKTMFWSFAGSGVGPTAELGIGTYMQSKEHILDEKNEADKAQMEERYGMVNPSLYRPETMPQQQAQSGDQTQPQPQRRQLTQEEIEKLRNQDITDEPVK